MSSRSRNKLTANSQYGKARPVMATFHVKVEVQRAVLPTKEEASEVGRILARYLANWTYSAKVVKVKVVKNVSP